MLPDQVAVVVADAVVELAQQLLRKLNQTPKELPLMDHSLPIEVLDRNLVDWTPLDVTKFQ